MDRISPLHLEVDGSLGCRTTTKQVSSDQHPHANVTSYVRSSCIRQLHGRRTDTVAKDCELVMHVSLREFLSPTIAIVKTLEQDQNQGAGAEPSLEHVLEQVPGEVPEQVLVYCIYEGMSLQTRGLVCKPVCLLQCYVSNEVGSQMLK